MTKVLKQNQREKYIYKNGYATLFFVLIVNMVTKHNKVFENTLVIVVFLFRTEQYN